MRLLVLLVVTLSLMPGEPGRAQGTIDGKWESDGKKDKTTFVFKVTGKAITGTVDAGGPTSEIESGVLDQKSISFTWTSDLPDGNQITRHAKGTVSPDRIDLAIDGMIASTKTKFSETLTLKRAK
jgi:hypothetical protein